MGRATGFVTKIYSKEITGRNGRTNTAWSFITKDNTGAESGFISHGFEQPSFKEGDYISYEAGPNPKGYMTADVKSIRVEEPPKEAVQAQAAHTASQEVRHQHIAFQSSRKDALHLMEILLANKAFPHTAAATKAGEAARYAEILAGVNRLTADFFRDIQEYETRVLEVYADTADVGKDVSEEDVDWNESGDVPT